MRSIAKVVATRSGLDESEAREVIDTVEEAIAPGSAVRAEELRFRLAERLGIEPARAIEVAQIACRAMLSRLDADGRVQLLRRLPANLRELFEPPPSLSADGGRAPRLAGTGHTLADGRPGSTHPVSGSRPAGSIRISESRRARQRVGAARDETAAGRAVAVSTRASP